MALPMPPVPQVTSAEFPSNSARDMNCEYNPATKIKR